MQPKWLNDGEPDENGDIIAVIENANGQRVSTFKGKTFKEVADKVLTSQSEANREISRLRRPDRASQPQTLTPKDSPVSAADRMRLANDVTDPDKIVEAVTEIVTAAQGGVAPRAVVQNVATMTDEQQSRYYADEASAFMQANPDYYPVQQNRDKIFNTIKSNRWDFTRNNLGIVFQTLLDQNELILWPEGENEGAPAGALPNGGGEEPPQMVSQPVTPPNGNSRPRSVSVSTGIRSRDASATPPPPKPAKKLTRAELEAMPRAEYNQRLANEPGFRKAVDEL